MAWVFFNTSALNPDEAWFLAGVENESLQQTYSRGADLAYGQAFWLSLNLMGSAEVARSVFYVLYLSVPWVLAWGAPAKTRPLVFLAWLAMPAAWWTGKLISPEIPALLGCAFALSCLVRGHMVYAGLAFGIAVGLKLLVAPLALLFPLFAWQQRDARRFVLSTLVGVLGFVLVSPAILQAPLQVLNQFFNSNRIGGSSRDVSDVLFHDPLFGLDMVSSGGFADFVFPLGVFALLVGALIYARVAWTILAAAGVIFTIFLWVFAESTTFYFRFYWFPFAALLVFLVGQSERSQRWLPAVLLLGFAFNLQTIVKHLGFKADQIAGIDKVVENVGCIALALSKENTVQVLDHFDYGTPLEGRLAVKAVNLFSADASPSHVVIGDRMQVGWALYPSTHRYPLVEIARCPNARAYRVANSFR